MQFTTVELLFIRNILMLHPLPPEGVDDSDGDEPGAAAAREIATMDAIVDKITQMLEGQPDESEQTKVQKRGEEIATRILGEIEHADLPRNESELISHARDTIDEDEAMLSTHGDEPSTLCEDDRDGAAEIAAEIMLAQLKKEDADAASTRKTSGTEGNITP